MGCGDVGCRAVGCGAVGCRVQGCEARGCRLRGAGVAMLRALCPPPPGLPSALRLAPQAGSKVVCVEDGLPTWVCELMVVKPTVQVTGRVALHVDVCPSGPAASGLPDLRSFPP